MSGVVALHDSGICTGHITLDHHILLGQDVYVCLINVESVNDANVTPGLDQSLRVLNRLAEARDIFTLGIVLWQISEEVRRFHRWQRFEPGIGKGPLPNDF